MPSARCLFWASGILILPRVAGAQALASPSKPSSSEHAMRLSWVRSAAAASCPDAGHVEADVEQRLGWSPFIHSSAASESIEALVTRENDVWHADIEVRAADGTSLGSRAVESPAATCASLSAAAGLAIALMIEPLLPPKPERATPTAAGPSTRTAAAPPQPAASKSSKATIPTAALPNESTTNASPNARGDLALGAVVVTGVLPHAAVGATLTGSTRLTGRWFAAASASFLPEQHLRENDADVGFGLTLGAIGPCYRIPIRSTWSFSSCAALLVGSLQITVQSPEPLTPGARLWWGASTGLRLGWNAGPFEAALGIDALAHVTRHSYLIQHAETSSSTAFFVEPAVALMSSLVAGVHY